MSTFSVWHLMIVLLFIGVPVWGIWYFVLRKKK